jgi:DNA segregation ATPase FtsK/SpoIIIE, S-DNA-T family
MASYQVRGRDPLLDSNTQAILERRGTELLGIGLLILALLMAMLLGSYTPNDPNWLMATDAPAQNWLGRFGAMIASPLIFIVGLASWGFVATFAAWGLRLVTHRGDERILQRIVFAPIAMALVSAYAASHAPGAAWSHSVGLGGMFGNTVLGAVLGVAPLPAAIGLKILAFLLAIASVALSLFALGFTKPELHRIGRFLLVGMVLLYDTGLRLMGRAASGASQRAQNIASRQAERHAERRDARRAAGAEAGYDDALIYSDAEPLMVPGQHAVQDAGQDAGHAPARIVRAETQYDQGWADETDAPAQGEFVEEYVEEERKTGLFARMPSLLKRAPEPDVIDAGDPQEDFIDATGSEESHGPARLQARISDVINKRVRRGPALTAGLRSEPPLTSIKHPRGPKPIFMSRGAPESQLQATELQAQDGDFIPDAAYEHDSTLVPADMVPSDFTGRDFAGADDSGQTLTAETFQTQEFTAQGQDPFTAHEAPENMFLEDEFDPAGYGVGNTQQPDQMRHAATTAPAPSIPVAAPKKVVQHSTRKAPQQSHQARAEAEPVLAFEADGAEYECPPLSLLENPTGTSHHVLSDEALEENARMLESVLDDYGVKGEIVSVRPGPVVTMYELEPAPGLKASRVIGLADDIARSMSALSARVSTVPGRSVIGIELPNEHREKVMLREILAARDFGDSSMKLPLALGKDIGGDAVVVNLAKMPHLLIAGTTGSGKSVAINTMILSLLYKLTPDECRLIMIDPKMLELSVYDGIPHLLSPVVTDPKKAVVALKWVVGEMEDRYRKMSKMGVRNIDGYNGRVKEALARGEMFSRTVQTGFDDETGDPVFETEELQPKSIPYIVVVVDEMADLMMVAGKEIEACIQRLAQMARASGIHLIMATQRPSVDVITGTIKANFPTRISFQVTSKIDSRTILGEQGAEQLLGMGDMLFMAGGAKITRVHGPFCSDEEVEEIVNYLKAYGPPDYIGGVVEGPEDEQADSIDAVLGLGGNTTGQDALYDQAVAIVIKDRKCSTSYIQRKLAIGYNKAARLVEQMEDQGLVTPANHVGKREILVPEQA